jgi:hypothetical protein
MGAGGEGFSWIGLVDSLNGDTGLPSGLMSHNKSKNA